jgi:hypothetical protein
MAGVFFGTCREGATRWGAARSDHRFALRNPIVRIINVAQSFERHERTETSPCIKNVRLLLQWLSLFQERRALLQGGNIRTQNTICARPRRIT